MNNLWMASRAAVYWRTFAPAVLTVAFIGYVFMTRNERREIVRPVVVVVEEGQFKRVAYHSSDRAYEIISIDLAEKFAKTLYEWQQSDVKSYAQRYLEFGNYLEKPSMAARRSKEYVERMIKDGVLGETSKLVIDNGKTKTVFEKGEWAVSLDCKRLLSSSSGSREENLEISILMKGGAENEVFKIYDYRIRTIQ